MNVKKRFWWWEGVELLVAIKMNKEVKAVKLFQYRLRAVRRHYN